MKPSIPAIQALKGADVCKVAAIVLLTLAAYWPVFHAGFVWDDDVLLTANPQISAANGVCSIWLNQRPVDYVPLTVTSFWLEYRLWGMHPLGYHLVNVALHTLAGILLWRILLRLKITQAWLIALVFAVHPVNVESVAWVVQRKTVLAFVLSLASLLVYLRFEERGRRAAYCAALGLFLMGLLAKTSVIALPVVLLGCAWWQRGRIDRRDIWRVAPFFVVALGMAFVALWIQQHAAAGALTQTEDLGSRVVRAGWAVWFYFFKALWPVNLMFVYPRWNVDSGAVLAYLPLLGVLALLCVSWIWRERLRGMVFGFGYFVATLFPVLGFFSIFYFKYSFVADHYQYQSLVAVVALLVTLLARLISPPLARVFLAAALIGTLTCLSFRQAAHYRDARTLWQDTLARNPTCWLAHIGFGLTSFEMGRFGEAIEHYQQSLRHGPENAEAHYDLALAFAQLGRLEEAELEFGMTLRLSPGHVESHNLLGNVLLQQGRPQEAEAVFRAALELDPKHAQAHNNLGCALARQARPREAEAAFERALALDPQQVSAHSNLGKLWASEGKVELAMDQYRVAVKLDGNFLDARCGLGELLMQAGRPREALEHFGRAVALRPDWAEGYYRHGVALVAAGDLKLGTAQYRQALRLRPDWVEVMNNLAWALATAPEPAVHDGGDAVRLAERACELTGRTNWTQWDTLAAAYAEAKRYPEAVRAAEKAIALAESTGSSNLATQTRERLHLYQSSRAFQE